MERQQALGILHEYTHTPNLRKHAYAVEGVMRHYAKLNGEDPELWGIVGLLHDFDYEIHPTPDQHPQEGSKILREMGVSEEIIHGILAHAPHTGEPRDTLLKKTIYAVDELSGFIIAVALVTPGNKLAEVATDKVIKKLKQRAFAAKVNRSEIYEGVDLLGIPLKDHVQNVLDALQGISDTLGL